MKENQPAVFENIDFEQTEGPLKKTISDSFDQNCHPENKTGKILLWYILHIEKVTIWWKNWASGFRENSVELSLKVESENFSVPEKAYEMNVIQELSLEQPSMIWELSTKKWQRKSSRKLWTKTSLKIEKKWKLMATSAFFHPSGSSNAMIKQEFSVLNAFQRVKFFQLGPSKKKWSEILWKMRAWNSRRSNTKGIFILFCLSGFQWNSQSWHCCVENQ